MALLKIKTLLLGTVFATLIYLWVTRETLQHSDDFKASISAREKSEPHLSTWPRGTFCHDFLVDTFHDAIPMCGTEVGLRDQVKCSGTVYSSKMMAACSVQYLALRPRQMRDVILTDKKWKAPKGKTINLLLHQFDSSRRELKRMTMNSSWLIISWVQQNWSHLYVMSGLTNQLSFMSLVVHIFTSGIWIFTTFTNFSLTTMSPRKTTI